MATLLKKKAPAEKPAPRGERQKKIPQIRVAKGAYYKQITKKVWRGLLAMLGIVVVIYACFAATIIRVIPTNTEMGAVPVKNSTFPGGVAEVGTEMVVSMSTPQPEGTLDRLKQSVLISTDAALVKVVAGPGGTLSWAETGLITVDGERVPVRVMNQPGGGFLVNEYIVECLEGACEKGHGYIVGADQVYGEPFRIGS